jgi:hypothetical protein
MNPTELTSGREPLARASAIINGPDHGQEIYNTTACGMLIGEMK